MRPTDFHVFLGYDWVGFCNCEIYCELMALKDWVPQVRKALDQAVTDHIVLTQSKLAQANPKDTGRMASSCFIGKDKHSVKI
jgi:hypothetical protein